jgi:Pectate lyase superfamily protein
MTYTTKTWNNFSTGGTPLNATGLNDLEARIAAGIAAAGSGSSGTTYYVSNTGSDAAAGTSTTTAWQTVAKVNAGTFTAGDSILFKRGDVWRTTTLVVPAAGITLGAYGYGRDPILSGGTLVTGWSGGGGGTYSASLAALPGVPPMVTYTVNNETQVLALGTGSGTLTANQYYFSGGTLWVNLGDTAAPTGDVEVASRQILTNYLNANLTFENLDFRFGSDSGVVIQDSTGHLFDSCSFRYITYNNNYAGALNWTHGGAGQGRVTNCTFDWLANDGIYTTNTKNIEIDHCTMTNIGSMVNDQQSDGIQFENYSGSGLNSDGFWIHDNYISMGVTTPKGGIIINSAPSLGASATGVIERNVCLGGNFGVAAHSNGVIVRNNTLALQTATNGAGVWIDANEVYTVGPTIAYNLFYGSRMGVSGGSGANSRHVSIVNNTFVDMNLAFIFLDSPIASPIIKNNIFWNAGANPTNHIIYISSITGTGAINNNLLDHAYTNCLRVGATEYASLAAWTAGTGYDANSLQGVDPLFNDPVEHDYHLRSTSTMIGAGAIVPNVNQDVVGSAVDIGAFEYDSLAPGVAIIPLVFNVMDAVFGATGNGTTNDTAAINNAIAAAVSAGGGVVWFPKGTYLANGIVISGNNVQLRGTGWGSVIKQVSGVADNTYLVSSFGTGTGVSSNRFNITVSDLQLLGRIDVDAATQYVHLLEFSGVSDAVVERCLFKAWRGDAVILASNQNGGTQVERHNERITIRDCRFDGVNNLNRNGITITDGTDIVIEKNGFTNCTATNRPGPIDIEPNANAYHRVRNVTIQDNSFDATCGGNAGVIGVFFNQAQTAYTTPIRGIKILRNTLRDCINSQGGIFLNQVQTTIASTPRQEILVEGNHIINGTGVMLEAWGIHGLKIKGNWFQSSVNAQIALGYASRCIDVEVSGNDLVQAGTTEGANIDIYNADRVRVTSNTFDDMGTAALGKIINFGDGTGGTATSSYVEVYNSQLIGSGATASAKTAGHTLAAANNLWVNNQIAAVGAHFTRTTF